MILLSESGFFEVIYGREEVHMKSPSIVNTIKIDFLKPTPNPAKNLRSGLSRSGTTKGTPIINRAITVSLIAAIAAIFSPSYVKSQPIEVKQLRMCLSPKGDFHAARTQELPDLPIRCQPGWTELIIIPPKGPPGEQGIPGERGQKGEQGEKGEKGG